MSSFMNIVCYYMSKLDVRETEETAAMSWKICSLVGQGNKGRCHCVSVVVSTVSETFPS